MKTTELRIVTVTSNVGVLLFCTNLLEPDRALLIKSQLKTVYKNHNYNVKICKVK